MSDPGWTGARREILVAALLIITLTAAAWMTDGASAAGLVLLICVAVSLIALRAVIEPHQEPAEPKSSLDLGPPRSFVGFWRTRSDLIDATRSLSTWNQELRPRLMNLLAARLAERHGISLADEPDAARQLLEAGRSGRHDRWTWIAPVASAAPAARDVSSSRDASSRPGIPPDVLAALIDRLERL
jgi:hypothetical protein